MRMYHLTDYFKTKTDSYYILTIQFFYLQTQGTKTVLLLHLRPHMTK